MPGTLGISSRTVFTAVALIALPAALRGGTPIPHADLTITKTRTSPAPVQPGGFIGYHILVTNNGPDAAVNVSMSDTVPAHTTVDEADGASGWTCNSLPTGSTGTFQCTIASLASGGSAELGLEVNIDAGPISASSIDNTATVTSSTDDPDMSNNSSTVLTGLQAVPTVPALSAGALAALAALVAGGALVLLRR